MNLTIESGLVGFDVDKYTQAVRRGLLVLMHDCAKEFLKVAASRVRVRTGFAHGSFGALAKYLGQSLPPGQPGTKPRPKEYYYISRRSRILKTRTSGQRFVKKDFIQEGAFGFVFEHDIDISYFEHNDENSHFGRSPWHSYRLGLIAFTRLFNKRAPDVFPDIGDFATTAR